MNIRTLGFNILTFQIFNSFKNIKQTTTKQRDHHQF